MSADDNLTCLTARHLSATLMAGQCTPPPDWNRQPLPHQTMVNHTCYLMLDGDCCRLLTLHPRRG